MMDWLIRYFLDWFMGYWLKKIPNMDWLIDKNYFLIRCKDTVEWIDWIHVTELSIFESWNQRISGRFSIYQSGRYIYKLKSIPNQGCCLICVCVCPDRYFSGSLLQDQGQLEALLLLEFSFKAGHHFIHCFYCGLTFHSNILFSLQSKQGHKDIFLQFNSFPSKQQTHLKNTQDEGDATKSKSLKNVAPLYN